jgi:hypothetical protein
VPFGDLLPIGRRVLVYCFDAGVKEYEFQDVFLLQRDFREHDFFLQKEEVDGLIDMDVEQGIRLFSGEIPAVDCRLLRNDAGPGNARVSAAEFVPCLDNYYLKLLLLAQRYFGGERSRLVI